MSPSITTRRATDHEANIPLRLSVSSLRSKRTRSSILTGTIEKPWIGEKDAYGLIAYFLTYAVALLRTRGSVARNFCLVMKDNLDQFNTDCTWTREVDMGSFGNGELETTTASSNNSFIEDGKLYIIPTLTSDAIGYDHVLDRYTYNITGCTDTNLTACSASSNTTSGTVMNPALSARLTKKNSHHIQHGKVEIVAKLPTSDWLWSALWMLCMYNAYGPWPMSGEIDIMEGRGNGPEYKARGRDVVRSSINWGPFTWLNSVSKTYGWWSVEWTPTFIRIYVDTRLPRMLTVSFDEPFFTRGEFPPFVANGSQTIQTSNPWANASGEGGDGGNAALFDQPLFLIMNVAAGGTNGWFPDGQAEWYATSPANPMERAMVVDSVKMWQVC
ncbi:concanavalin A-like lectin/glucanase [Trametopsis cervina]|nr:concanavalin A-like lectin/glucanase [Trametopsis cervina]